MPAIRSRARERLWLRWATWCRAPIWIARRLGIRAAERMLSTEEQEKGNQEMPEQASAGFWLSPQQKFAWRLQQEALGKAARGVAVVRMEGPVDAGRVQECLKELVARHEILRTVFRRQTGMKVPFQVVLETAEIDWEQVDFSAAGAEQKLKFDALFEAEKSLERNVEAAPVLRAVLVTLAQGQFALLLNVPLLCADARSLGVLVRELGMLYSGQREQLAE